MSYCRFSSSNWRSDVYVYEHCYGGWVTHVAGSRRAIPPIPDIPIHWMPSFGGKWSMVDRKMTYPSRWHRYAARIGFGVWALWHHLNMLSLAAIPLKSIGLPHDGESFSAETPGECADRLESLRALGYFVPQYAIDALREESRIAASTDNGESADG